MNLSTAVFLINKDLRAILATYEGDDLHGKKTMFKTLDKSIKVGDFIVVPTSTRHGMTVCKVVDADVTVDFDDATKVEWAVGRIDVAAYQELKKQEDQAIEVLKAADFRTRREKLASDLTASAAEIKALPIYKNGTV